MKRTNTGCRQSFVNIRLLSCVLTTVVFVIMIVVPSAWVQANTEPPYRTTGYLLITDGTPGALVGYDRWETDAGESGDDGVVDLLSGDPNVIDSLLWAYGDPTGRVRAKLQAWGSGSLAHPPIPVGGGVDMEFFQKHDAITWWTKSFVKGSAGAKTTATILPSFVTLTAPLGTRPTLSGSGLPYVCMSIKIRVQPIDAGSWWTYLPEENRPAEDLHQHVCIEGYTNDPTAAAEITAGGWAPGDTELGLGPFHPYLTPSYEGWAARVDLSRVVQELDLDHIPNNTPYAVRYILTVEGGLFGSRDVSNLEAYLADPLDVDDTVGGISLATTDQPGTAPLPRICAEAFDSQRYALQPDGTVTDRYTGLMWQRCASGYTLDDGATPDVLSDDQCLPDTGSILTNDWQTSLQAAQSDALAGYSNWRLPNVKELDSLVTQCFSGMIEPELFPNTPKSAAFWSATPVRDNAPFLHPLNVWQVSFRSGDVSMADKSMLGYARLVRDTGLVPIAPLPKLIAGGVSQLEGDTGSVQALFPITLSSPADSNVTVDYAILSPNNHATDGVDFAQTSGSLTFLPGEVRKQVAVTIHGDTESENNEYLHLKLSNPSANVRLARDTGVGFIVDDEPVITLGRPYEAEEGDSGDNRQAQIRVVLDKPAASIITVDYSLAGETAIIGTDLMDATGTLSFNIGDDEAIITVDLIGDEWVENDERFNVLLTAPVGAMLQPGVGDTMVLPVILVDDDGPGTYAALNDTGIQLCATDSQVALGCPQVGFPVQDAEIGRDADPAANDDQDGKAGFSFTKLDGSGVPLIDQSLFNPNPWSCVRDEITGLTWEVKLDTPSQLHLPGHTYSWYNSTGVNDGGVPGTENGGICADTVYCDTAKYVAAVNAENFCGYSDWRLPTLEELFTLVHAYSILWNHDHVGSAVNRFFPHMRLESLDGTGLWSATPEAGGDVDPSLSQAWRLTATGIDKDTKRRANRIRLVRGGN